MEGLEPPRLAAPEPKSGASTNFATPASQIEIVFSTPLSKGFSGFESKNEFLKKILKSKLTQLVHKTLIF